MSKGCSIVIIGGMVFFLLFPIAIAISSHIINGNDAKTSIADTQLCGTYTHVVKNDDTNAVIQALDFNDDTVMWYTDGAAPTYGTYAVDDNGVVSIVFDDASVVPDNLHHGVINDKGNIVFGDTVYYRSMQNAIDRINDN